MTVDLCSSFMACEERCGSHCLSLIVPFSEMSTVTLCLSYRSVTSTKPWNALENP